MTRFFWRITTFLVFLSSCNKNGKPGLVSISTIGVEYITSNSAQTGGVIGGAGGGIITQNGICWAMHSSPNLSDSVLLSNVNSGIFIVQLKNLHANTVYYVRAFSINSAGAAYGNVDSFLTKKGIPTVQTIPITGISPLLARGGGVIANDGGDVIGKKGLCWSTAPLPTIVDFHTNDGPGPGPFTDSLEYLDSSKTYYVRAYATNAYGTGYGSQIVFTASPANTILDRDGNVYPFVKIGAQTWMGSNLRTAHYQNGDPIVNGLAVSFDWWGNALFYNYIGAYTFPNLDSSNNTQYGKLYNNYAVNDSRGICPLGWHVPSDAEWTELAISPGNGSFRYDGTLDSGHP